ncbi:hypothetical protein GGR53DRAFT_467963 [Hypoxylon sp. FL1150]|nr:hypothetical protein GGR53DRAFT_467963 [Hypoxylon sp. FL1150]
MTTPTSEQLWFFLREDMSRSVYSQDFRTISEVRKMNLTLESCLKTAGVKGNPGVFAFYIHSQSMAAAVRLLSDESIITTYNLYCQKDNPVHIIIRDANDPSPNSSRCPSHESSLAQRRKVSASRGLLVPDLFIQPKIRHASGSTDISTMECIKDESTMVSIKAEDDFVTFTKEYLLGWINAKLTELKRPEDIIVQAYTPAGAIMDVPLTSAVWQRSLLRGPWKDEFGGIWNKDAQIRCLREEFLDEISKSVPEFRQSCRSFVYDLRTFGKDKGFRARLEGTLHEFFMGMPYFSDSTRDRLMRLPTRNGDLEGTLRALANKRKEDGTICASHDLAPLFEVVLGLRWDKEEGKALFEELKSVGGFSMKTKEIAKRGSNFIKGTFGRKSKK